MIPAEQSGRVGEYRIGDTTSGLDPRAATVLAISAFLALVIAVTIIMRNRSRRRRSNRPGIPAATKIDAPATTQKYVATSLASQSLAQAEYGGVTLAEKFPQLVERQRNTTDSSVAALSADAFDSLTRRFASLTDRQNETERADESRDGTIGVDGATAPEPVDGSEPHELGGLLARFREQHAANHSGE